MSTIITFEGHGLWGVGGGMPEAGVYQADIKDAEYRGSRMNAESEKKLYWTASFEGADQYDNSGLPGKGKKAGVEKAFVRFLLATGALKLTAEQVRGGALKGKKIDLDKIIATLNGGAKAWIHFLPSRGQGDRAQITYLLPDEVEKVKSGEITIKDSRQPFQAAPSESAADDSDEGIDLGLDVEVEEAPPAKAKAGKAASTKAAKTAQPVEDDDMDDLLA